MIEIKKDQQDKSRYLEAKGGEQGKEKNSGIKIQELNTRQGAKRLQYFLQNQHD